jgi:hypothetical protein
MRKADILSAAILFTGGLITLFVIIPLQTTEGEKYGLPPAFFPTCSMVVLTVLSALLLLKGLFSSNKDSDTPAPLGSKSWLTIGSLSALLFLSLAAIKYLGFIIGGILMVASFMIYMRERRLITISLVSLITPLVIYIVLWKFLRILLP